MTDTASFYDILEQTGDSLADESFYERLLRTGDQLSPEQNETQQPTIGESNALDSN